MLLKKLFFLRIKNPNTFITHTKMRYTHTESMFDFLFPQRPDSSERKSLSEGGGWGQTCDTYFSFERRYTEYEEALSIFELS